MFNPNVTPYTPGNIDDTTRMLIGLKQKGQLQQYVQQHSQDPNLVALALYVNNLDNAARGAQAMQSQQQQQPTVLEEKMAQMAPQQLPEDVGIGALPVQGMDHFADGGIVGYAGAGAGPNPASGPAGRLAYNNEPVLRMADGGIVAFDGGGVASLGSVPSYSATNPNAGFTEFLRKMGLSAQEFISASPQAQKSLREMFTSGAAEAPAASAASAAPAATATGGYGSALRSAATKYLGPLSAIASNLFFTSPEEMDTLRKADAKRAMESLPQSTFKGYGDTSDIDQMIEWGAKQQPPATDNGKQPPAPPRAAPAAAPAAAAPSSIVDQLKAFREAMGIKDETFDRDAELARRKEYLGEHPSKAQMERLAKLDEMAKAEKEDAFNMSLLRAGLGMMASKSPFALVGIGEGATKGVESYEDALKTLKTAEREREKMRMDVESAAYSARSNDLKAVDDKYNSFLTRREQNADRLASVFGTLKSAEMHVKGQENAARIAASHTPAEIQLIERIARERGIPFMQAYNETSGTKPEMAFAQLYAKHVAEAQKNMTEPLPPAEFARLMRSAATAFRPQVVDTDNPSGKLYSR